MKKIILIILTFFLHDLVNGQMNRKIYKTYQLMEEQTFYLNSATRVGGKTRNSIKIELPNNTTHWYYAFTTTSNTPPKSSSIGLATQLAKFITNGTLTSATSGVVGGLAYQIVKPTGAGICDIYLVDDNGYNQFYQKDALGTWQYSKPTYYEENSKENAKEGTIGINNKISGNYYLCFKNPSVMEGVFVTAEAVAIVEETEYIDEWSAENKQIIYSNCINSFPKKDASVQEICDCLKQKLISQYSPTMYSQLSNSEKEFQAKKELEICYSETGNVETKNAQEQIKMIAEEIRGLTVIKDYNSLAIKYKQLINLGADDYQICNSAAYYLLLTKNYEEAKIYLVKGLGKSPENLYLLGNLAHYYLLTNQYKNAEEIYLAHKKEKLRKDLKWEEAVKEDFLLFESVGIYHTDFEKIRKLLKITK